MSVGSTLVYGDFQTPDQLAREVVELVASTNGAYAAVVEPTCGVGAFVTAAGRRFGVQPDYYAFDINPDHVRTARDRTAEAGVRARVECADFYERDWRTFFHDLPEDLLVVGNPPWVTNAALGVNGGANLPVKSNFQGHSGFAAKTGKANFDISEWMLIQLVEALQGKQATLAMLCKTATARKVLRHAWRNNLDLGRTSLHLVDAARHFGVSVDACLLLTHFGVEQHCATATIFGDLSFDAPIQTFGMVNGDFVSDVDAYRALSDLDGVEYRKWRSGVKHDAAKVMEFEILPGGGLRNGLGQEVHLEPDYVFPLLKSSDLANARTVPRRAVLLTQRAVGDDTREIASVAPATWRYLTAHAQALDGRRSSIYAKRSRFSVFGVGPYSFSPWKVAVSGLYKTIKFVVVGSDQGPPVMVDDTCYFIPCASEHEAEFFARLLNSEVSMQFIHSLVFFDSKRAITVDVLKRIDLKRLAQRLGEAETAAAYLADAHFDAGPQQMHVFERPGHYRTNGST